MTTLLNEATAYRTAAELQRKEHEALIEFQANQILLLVAKLDELTGKKAPGLNHFAA